MFVRLDNARDLLSSTLLDARLGGVLMSRSTLRAPFALAFGRDASRPGLHIVRRGTCWIALGDGEPLRLGRGDLALLPHGAAHRLCDDPSTPAVTVADLAADIPPGGRIALPFGEDGPETEVICCAYDIAVTTTPILRGLPALVHVPQALSAGTALATLLDLLQSESAAACPGAALARSRLIDLVFVYALRVWLEAGHGRPTSWIDAAADPSIGPVLEAIHASPGHDWSLAALSRLAGRSRAVFAKAFRDAVGEPPMGYLARLRMAEAARRLDGGERISNVVAAVGYSNEFAFAKAFKRIRGVTPGQARRRARTSL